MLTAFLRRTAASIVDGARQVCLVVGAALISLTVAVVMLPFVVGMALVALARWGAERNAAQPRVIIIPAGA